MIEIMSVNPVNKGDLLATVTVYIRPWKLKIHEIAVFQKGANRFISMPSRKWEKDGETRYTKYLEFDDAAVEKRFRDQIMQAIDAYVERQGDLIPEDVIKIDDDFPF